MQCLRTKNEIHKGSPLADFSPFLTGHTAAHSDNEVRIFLFQLFPAPQLVKDFFLGFFADGAGIEQDDVSVLRTIGLLEPMTGVQ